MRLTIDHTTVYTYTEPTRRVIQLLRLTPCNFAGQSVLDWRVDVDCDACLREGRDGYGNITHMLYVEKPIQRLSISVSGRVLTEDQSGMVRGLTGDLPVRRAAEHVLRPRRTGFRADVPGSTDRDPAGRPA